MMYRSFQVNSMPYGACKNNHCFLLVLLYCKPTIHPNLLHTKVIVVEIKETFSLFFIKSAVN